MAIFLVTFVIIAVVIALMAVGVMFGRAAIKGSCGGVNSDCVCATKCDKRLKWEAEQSKLAAQE